MKNVIINATLNLNLVNIFRLLDIKTWYCVNLGKTRYESWIEETINIKKLISDISDQYNKIIIEFMGGP